MTRPDWPTGVPQSFGGLEPEFSDLDRARCAILPVPYDFTTSYQGGTRSGPRAILEASRNMELWDEELGATYRAGIHTLPELEPTALGPEAMVDRVEQAVSWILDRGKLPVMLGGEHSITAGAVRAAARRFKRLSVLQLDAHADLRDRYLDSPYSHACVMRRVRERVPVASVGIRSMSEEEAQFLRREPAPMWSTRQFRALGGKWQPVLSALTEEVYVTFDLDALDPSILPATGTPEPGGLDWFEAVDLLRAVSERASIVGFDIVELAPIPGQVASDFLAARLTYRAIGLALAGVGTGVAKS
ncbi:MAG: agmatinase [Candidatus Eisenbacteria bacterium]|uniref:Agmatinase n=1 Tax=Eiseniibacteriota bacterium TaxID=2212470 RepID=A0A538SSG3_UNCEI|nr:MAG: agmatinase [Candidatus Eisenbacteria bacterium]